MAETRDNRITFRMSDSELELLDRYSDSKGLKRSECIREIVLKEVNNIPPVEVTKEILQASINSIFDKKGIQIMDIDFKNQSISTLKNGKVSIYKFELIENNTVIRFKNELGVIVFQDNLI